MPADEQPKSEAPSERLTRAGWRDRARTRFGTTPHAIAGALHDVDADKTLTEAQVKQRLDKFLKHKPGESE